MKEVLEAIIQKFGTDPKFAIVTAQANSVDSLSSVFSTMENKHVYAVMMDTARKMASLRGDDTRVAEGCLVISSNSEADDMVIEAGKELEKTTFDYYIVGIQLNGGISVYAKGYPVVMAYYALRSCLTMEDTNGGPFPPPFRFPDPHQN